MKSLVTEKSLFKKYLYPCIAVSLFSGPVGLGCFLLNSLSISPNAQSANLIFLFLFFSPILIFAVGAIIQFFEMYRNRIEISKVVKQVLFFACIPIVFIILAGSICSFSTIVLRVGV